MTNLQPTKKTGVNLESKFFSPFFSYLASTQGEGRHNSVSQLLWAHITYPTLSTCPVGGNRSTRRKPTTFGRALTILFSHEDWVRVWFESTLLGIELGTLEVKGEWPDHYITEAPTSLKMTLLRHLRPNGNYILQLTRGTEVADKSKRNLPVFRVV